MKTKLIILGGFVVLLFGVIVLAAKDKMEDLFVSNIDANVKAEISKIMNTMTAEQALQLRIQQISAEMNQKQVSEENLE